MNDVTQLLNAAQRGDSHFAAELLPLVYDELRRLAAAKLADEKASQTLQPTALVHEAYLRLVGPDARLPTFENRRHFFGAASQAMRRILVERARHRASERHGGGRHRQEIELRDVPELRTDEEVLGLHEALERLAAHDPGIAKLVEMRFFAGLTLEQAAECLGVSLSTANRNWRYARAWLYTAMADEKKSEIPSES